LSDEKQDKCWLKIKLIEYKIMSDQTFDETADAEIDDIGEVSLARLRDLLKLIENGGHR
jgi:hypothetical protein